MRLSAEDYGQLASRFEAVLLGQGQVLHQPLKNITYIYFPQNAVISLMSVTEHGASIEVGMISCEGIVGVSAILGAASTPFRAIVQAPGSAIRMRADHFARVFTRSAGLQSIVHRYLHGRLIQLSQSAVCNRFHTIEQRLARWLLDSQDRIRTGIFPYTQEFLSDMLGTDRSSVSLALGLLKRAGLIGSTRAQVSIVDRKGLKEITCECYEIVRTEFGVFECN
jgi:CRP-like cAMP-binding protein